MTTFFLTLLIFLEILQWCVIISVLLSWVGIKIKFIDSILEPCYTFIEKYIPTKIGPLSFTPVIVIIAIHILSLLIFAFDPETQNQYYQIMNYLQNA